MPFAQVEISDLNVEIVRYGKTSSVTQCQLCGMKRITGILIAAALITADPVAALSREEHSPARGHHYSHTTPARCTEQVPNTAVALCTGMVSDLAMTPNIGIEIPLSCIMSVNASWYGAWWENTAKAFCWKLYGGKIGMRGYLGRHTILNKMTGHHIGVNFMAYTFDFCLGGKGVQAPVWNWGAELEYGYKFPIARNLYLDAHIGVGAMWGAYHTYTPMDSHFVWQDTRQHCYWGPTTLEISLFYHFQKHRRHE